MKKIFSAILAVVALQGASTVEAGCFDCCDSCWQSPALEVKFAGLYPFESRVREVYNDVLPVVELEASILYGCNWKPWVNVGYVWDNGKSIVEPNDTEIHHSSTDIRVIPLTFGVDYVFNWACNTDFYIGAGAAYSWLRIHDHSEYVHEHVNKGAWGGTARAGIIYHWSECVFVEGFLDYFYTRFSFSNSDDDEEFYVERNDLNLSSLKFGIGLGYNF